MAGRNPTIYLTNEEYKHLEQQYDSISGGVRGLVQADMEGEGA